MSQVPWRWRESPEHQSPCHSTMGTDTDEYPSLDPETRNLWSPPPVLGHLSPVPDAPGLPLWEGREPKRGGHRGNRAARVKTYFKLCSVVVVPLKTQAVK